MRSFFSLCRRTQEVYSKHGLGRVRAKAVEFFLHSPVLWGNFGDLSQWISRVSKLEDPPVLLVSFPRSGSSWVGKMLGGTDSALYLREPITQSIVRDSSLSVPFEVSRCDESEIHAFAKKAFTGTPSFDNLIVKEPEEWSVTDRGQKRLVIKEPNPLLLPWMLDLYDFRAIYLLRHPAAVAASFDRLGWNSDEVLDDLPIVREKIEDSHRNSFWNWHGALQAVVSRMTARALHEHDHSYHTVRYERLCRRPVETFRRLFDFAGLAWSERDRKRVVRHSEATNERRDDPYDTKRDSSEMLNAWRDDVPESQLQCLRKAFLHYDPPFYSKKWW